MNSVLKGKVALVTGASRGIGRAIALRLAKDGARLGLISKTVQSDPRKEGSLTEVEQEVQRLGGEALVLGADVRFEDQIQSAVEQAASHWGGVDLLVNNAGMVHLTPTESTPLKKFDGMHAINSRAPFVLVQAALPHLKKSSHAHILNISPPLGIQAKWLSPHLGYTLSKYAMSLCTLGWAGEFQRYGIAANSLWPKTLIATAAMRLFPGVEVERDCRDASVVADAAHWILRQPPKSCTGRLWLDEEALRQAGVTDFSRYQSPGAQPRLDLYVEGFTHPQPD